MPEPTGPDSEENQCRICFDGVDAEQELGRLIRPCLCRGTISLVHVKCLQKWRTSSQSAFFSCPQCHYQYRFSRTKISGVASNPLIVGGISAFIFTLITLASSFITTYLLAYFQGPSSSSFYFTSSSSYWYIDPTEVVHDLVRAALRIIQDEDSVFDVDTLLSRSRSSGAAEFLNDPDMQDRSSFLKQFIQRFVIGLPLIGAASLIHFLVSLPFIGPVHWLARFRAGRRRNNESRDISALIIVVLIIIGIARALYGVYRLVQSATKRLLLRAEDAILEVR